MNGTKLLGGVVLVVGLLVLLGGLAMPSTTTTTSTSCYDNPMGYGQDCVESTYETPNSSKGPTILFGLIGTVAGGWLLRRSGSTADRGPEPSAADSDWTGDDSVTNGPTDPRSDSERPSDPADRPTDSTADKGFAQQVREAHDDD